MLERLVTYIAYFYSDYDTKNAIVLCVSSQMWECRYYCEKIRKLNRKQYEIRQTLLDETSRCSLYEDYILVEFDETYNLLTNQDILYLTKEVDTMIDRWENLAKEMKAFKDLLKTSGNQHQLVCDFGTALKGLNNNLSSVHSIRELCQAMYKSSPVLSPNIYEYLNHMKMLQYDRELNDMYTWKLSDDSE